jgi:histidine triad (HIT) family protein
MAAFCYSKAMKPDCLFCKIARDDSTLVWQNDDYAAFKDIHPQARLHLLVVPKEHVENLDALTPEQAGGLIAAVQAVAKQQGVAGAYKLRFSVGRAGGQEVDHVHAHILAD